MLEMPERWVWSLNQEHPLEKGTATHSSILTWRIPWTVYSMGLQSRTPLSDFFLHFSFFTQYIGLGIWSHHFKGNRWENWKQCQALVFWPPKSLQRDHSPKENSNVVNIVAWLDVGQTKTSRHQLHKDMKKKKRLRFHLGKTGLIKDVTKIGKLAELSLSPKSWSRFRY